LKKLVQISQISQALLGIILFFIWFLMIHRSSALEHRRNGENLRRDQEFKPKHAIALSNFTILGGAIANTLANLRRSAGGGPGKSAGVFTAENGGIYSETL